MTPPSTSKSSARDDAAGVRSAIWAAVRPRLWLAGQVALIAGLALSLVGFRFAAAQHRAPASLAELVRWAFQGL